MKIDDSIFYRTFAKTISDFYQIFLTFSCNVFSCIVSDPVHATFSSCPFFFARARMRSLDQTVFLASRIIYLRNENFYRIILAFSRGNKTHTYIYTLFAQRLQTHYISLFVYINHSFKSISYQSRFFIIYNLFAFHTNKIVYY